MRLIDAHALGRDTFHVMCEGEYGEPCERCVVDWDDIETAPTVDAVPVVHGRWIAQDSGRTRFMCSECKSKNHHGHENYCPNCGAKMDGGNIDGK